MSSLKRRRRKLSIEEKLQILNQLEAGQSKASISRLHDVSDSALRSIQCRGEQLRRFAANCPAEALKSFAYIPRSKTAELTEFLLNDWYDKERAERGSQSGTFTIAEICVKAREIYGDLIAEESGNAEDGESREFKASKGWFNTFRKRFNIELNVPLDGGDTKFTWDDRRTQFQTALRAGEYRAEQVFTATELILPWRSLPVPATAITSTATASDRDRISLLLCSNASGDFVVKPMLVFRTKSPYSLRCRDIDELPVFWRARSPDSQSSPRVTPHLLQEWVRQCFAPSVRDYLLIMELPERCMLLLDSSLLTTAAAAQATNPFVRLERSDSPSPLKQYVLPTFHCIYLRLWLTHLLKAIEQQTPNTLALMRARCNWKIADTIDLIAEALEEIESNCWNQGWAQLWPEIVRQPTDATALATEMKCVLELCHKLPGSSYTQLTVEHIKRHLKLDNEGNNTPPPVDDQASAADSILIDEEMNAAGEEQQAEVAMAPDSDRVTVPQQSDLRAVSRVLRLANELVASLHGVGAVEHAHFIGELQTLLQPYREYKERLLQPSITTYFKSQGVAVKSGK